MEKYCGVRKFDLSLLYCVLILISCFVMIGVMDTYLEEKKVNIWQYLALMSHIGVKT